MKAARMFHELGQSIWLDNTTRKLPTVILDDFCVEPISICSRRPKWRGGTQPNSCKIRQPDCTGYDFSVANRALGLETPATLCSRETEIRIDQMGAN
jgi:hypothetical protein